MDIESRRRPLPDELSDQLRRRIVAGELRPGDRLPPERDLADDLSVNRSSVREALKKLEQLRLVAPQPGSGTRVLDPQHASLELVAAFLADDAGGDWARDLLRAREILAGSVMREALERGRREALDDLERTLLALGDERLPDAAFSEALGALPGFAARVSGNRVLILLANALLRFGSGGSLGAAVRETCARQRRALAPSLRRLGVAVGARDVVAAESSARELFGQLADAAARVDATASAAGSAGVAGGGAPDAVDPPQGRV